MTNHEIFEPIEREEIPFHGHVITAIKLSDNPRSSMILRANSGTASLVSVDAEDDLSSANEFVKLWFKEVIIQQNADQTRYQCESLTIAVPSTQPFYIHCTSGNNCPKAM